MTEDEAGGVFDSEAMNAVMEKLADVVRPLGLTVHPGIPVTAQVDLASGEVVAMVPIIVRPSAKQRLKEDRQAAEEFSQLMARQNEERIRAEADKIRALANDREALARHLFEDIEPESECSHDRRHPDGFCLDCGDGMAL